MTDELRNLMRSAVAGEPSNTQAWANFRATKRRSTVARTMIALTGAVAAFIMLILLLPGVKAGQGDRPINVGPSVSPLPPKPSKHYADAAGRFQLFFPSPWVGRGIAGISADFFPRAGDLNEASELMTFDGGGDQPVRTRALGFFVRVHLRKPGQPSELSDPADLPRRASGGAAIKRGGIFPPASDEVYVDQLRVIYPAAPVEPAAGWSDGEPRYWCGGCIVEEVAIKRANDTLEVLIVAPGQDAYDKFHELAVAVLDSIDRYTAPRPSTSTTRLR